MAITSPQSRVAAGVPTGGEFAAQTRNESEVSLGAAPTVDTVYTVRKGHQNGVYRLENDITDPPATRDGIFMTKMVRIGGTPHVNAAQKTIAAASYPDAAVAQATAIQLAAAGKKMTVLGVNSSGYATLREGTGVVYRGAPMLKSKGSSTKGYQLESLNILDVREGYGKMQALADEYNHRANLVPAVEASTFDGIPDTTDWDGQEPPNDISAVYLVDGPDFGDGPTPGCLFLATDVQDGQIVNGYLWAPESSGLYSEHGSMYTKDLINKGGRIRGYEPGSLTFSQVMDDRLGATYESAYGILKASEK